MNPTSQDTKCPVDATGFRPGDPRSDLMDPELRDRLFVALAALGREFPSMRFGQLICAVTTLAREIAIPDSIYDVEDEELFKSAVGWLERRQADR